MEEEGEVERLQDGATVQEEFNVDQKPLRGCGSDAATAAMNDGCFDCNICLDFAADPVVTLCGHLYCWPCIYKWLQQGSGDSPQQCPVCKAVLLQQSLVPLYGRGQSAKASHQCLDILRRPPLRREAIEQRLQQSNQEQNPEIPQQHLLEFANSNGGQPSPSSTLEMARVMHSAGGGALGGMAVAVLSWMFRNQGWTSVYYSSPYHIAGNGGGPRVRRQELELERSLHQIWVFLFCCAILCLILF